ncbi:hypothetical protein NQ317_009148 [Molorchus minor]|uniref:ZAD domain-containing protein n=1 Tax=Molorchus minor TaxID=1323400 RepID=A0ABQ9K030_9CUCU|nr:hypothetical protein NQ317_009148 [Molorchus minor]
MPPMDNKLRPRKAEEPFHLPIAFQKEHLLSRKITKNAIPLLYNFKCGPAKEYTQKHGDLHENPVPSTSDVKDVQHNYDRGDPAVCISCVEHLTNYSKFIGCCVSTEEKINEVCEAAGTKAKGQMKLSNMLVFF